MLLVGTQQSLNFDSLAEAMVLQWPDFRGAPPIAGGNAGGNSRESKGGGKGKGSAKPSFRSSSTSSGSTASSSNSSRNTNFTRKVYVTENAEAPEDDDQLQTIDEADEFDEASDQEAQGEDDDQSEELQPDDDAEPDITQLAEVLTLTAKKLSGLTLGRKFTGRPKAKGSGKSKGGSIEDAKKNTHCSVCGAQGHWYQDPECPANAGVSKLKDKNKSSAASAKPHKVAFIHHEHGATEISAPSATSYGNMFTVGMIQHYPSTNPDADIHSVHEVKINGPESFAGYLVLDTGCQRTCCGEAWFSAHSQLLREHDLVPKVISYPDSFKFGKGTPSHSEVKMYAPSAIGGAALLLAGSILSESIPFLASNSLLTSLGAVFNLVNDTVVFMNLNGAKAKIKRIGGHMTLSILDFKDENPKAWQVWNEFSHETLWNEPHPEFILSSQARPASLTSLRSEFADDPISTVLVGSMASPLQPDQEGDVRYGQVLDGGHQPGDFAKGGVASTSTPCAVEGEPSKLPAHIVQEVRQRPRPLRNMQSVREQLEVEPRVSEVGNQGSSWVKRSLYSLAAFATTFLGNDFGATTRNFAESQGGIPNSFDRSSSQRKDEAFHQDYDTTLWRHGEWPVDQLLADESYARRSSISRPSTSWSSRRPTQEHLGPSWSTPSSTRSTFVQTGPGFRRRRTTAEWQGCWSWE